MGYTYPSKRFQTLLLSVSVHVEPNDEPHNVEERNPGVLGEELLSKRQRKGRANPADPHDWHETSPDGCADLVVSARTSNHRHRRQINCILNG